MSKICIFCRKAKSKFSEEHVFPAAIGGAFVIYSVCDDCNKILGKNIDVELCRNRRILYFRNIYGIKRSAEQGSRDIANPFNGTGYHLDEEGNEYYITFNKEKNVFEPTRVPQYFEPTLNNEGKLVGQIIIPAINFKNIEEVKLQYAKKHDINPDDISNIVIKSNEQKQMNLTIQSQTRPLTLGCLKIAYEFAISKLY